MIYRRGWKNFKLGDLIDIKHGYAFKSKHFISRGINRDFLYWLTRSNKFNYFLSNSASGTSTRHTSPTTIKEYSFALPPLPEQTTIAEILSSLDDKISLLRRQNKTLEDMAQLLFKRWFTKGAKEEWEHGELGDIIDLKYGKQLKKSSRSGDGYPVIGSSGIIGLHSDYLAKGPGIVIGRRGTLGKKRSIISDNFFPIDTTFYIESKIASKSLVFEYFLLKSIDFQKMNTDSAVPGINRTIALQTKINIPPYDKIEKFNLNIGDEFKKIYSNNCNMKTLSKLKTILLPSLFNGNIGIKIQS